MLTDCLEACQANESCGAVNYETGLCVLFSSNADKLPGMCNVTEKDFAIFGTFLLFWNIFVGKMNAFKCVYAIIITMNASEPTQKYVTIHGSVTANEFRWHMNSAIKFCW